MTIDPVNADPGSYQELPCGCVMWNQGGPGGQFIYRPCSFTCEFYQHVLDESARLGHPTQMRLEQ